MTTLSIPKDLKPYQDRYRVDLVENAYSHEAASVIGHAAAMAMVLLFLGDSFPVWLSWTWGGALAAATAIRIGLAFAHRRRSPDQYGDRHVIVHALGVSTSALAWSIGFHGALFYLDNAAVAELLMIFAGICAGAVITLSSRVETYLMFTGLMLGPPTVTLLRSNVPGYVSMGVLATFFLLFCGVGVRNANRMARSALLRRYQNEDILLDLATAKNELEDAWSRSEQANKAKREFLANISHEVRTPLNGILGMTDLVLESDDATDRRTNLLTLRRCGQNLLALVDDLLDLSKMESGRLQVEQVRFNLHDLATESIDVHAVQARKKGALVVRLDFADDCPHEVVGDPVRIRQILHNLIANAIKFTQEGEVRLVVRAQEQKDDKRLLLQVQDTGIGIPSDRQEAVFDSFTQVDGTTTRKFGGTGLGLSICRNLAELMGGSIKLSSEIGVGSVFTVELPLQQQVEESASAAIQVLLASEFAGHAVALTSLEWDVATTDADSELWQDARALFREDSHVRAIICSAKSYEENSGLFVALQRNIDCVLVRAVNERQAAPIAGTVDWQTDTGAEGLRALLTPEQDALPELPGELHVLLAEDDAINAKLVVHYLEQHGHTVRVARDGEEVVRLFCERHPDLILMDCQMPVLDGPGATRRIREQSGGSDVPIVALTANDSPADCQEFLAAGMDACMSKPFTRSTLQRALEIVQRARTESSVLTTETD